MPNVETITTFHSPSVALITPVRLQPEHRHGDQRQEREAGKRQAHGLAAGPDRTIASGDWHDADAAGFWRH
jgi:hypothetical protein